MGRCAKLLVRSIGLWIGRNPSRRRDGMTSLNSILLRALDRYKVIVLQTAELQPRYVSSKLLCFVVISFTELTTAGGT